MATNPESLDTSVIIRIITGDVPELRQKAIKLATKPGTVFHISDLAITESVFVLEKIYAYSRPQITERILDLLGAINCNYNQALFDQVFPFYLAHPKLSFNDCCLAAYAALNKAEPLWTFDKKFATQSPTAKEIH